MCALKAVWGKQTIGKMLNLHRQGDSVLIWHHHLIIYANDADYIGIALLINILSQSEEAILHMFTASWYRMKVPDQLLGLPLLNDQNRPA